MWECVHRVSRRGAVGEAAPSTADALHKPLDKYGAGAGGYRKGGGL